MDSCCGSNGGSPVSLSERVMLYPPAPAVAAVLRALIILPGGGYHRLAEHEGDGYARWFAARGVRCYVLKYFTASEGNGHRKEILSSLAAGLTVALADWQSVDTEGVGKWIIMGSSAGGHLAAVHSTLSRSLELPAPDGTVLCYPVISFTDEPIVHTGSRCQFLGPVDQDDATARARFSPELNVSPDTPPAFLWHTCEDTPVPPQNSLRYAEALLENGIPCELHLYPQGRHGLGLAAPYPWAQSCLTWLKAL